MCSNYPLTPLSQIIKSIPSAYSTFQNIFITKQRQHMHSAHKLQSQAQFRACNGCDTITSNLVLMPCGHRLCMSCIKNIKLPNTQHRSVSTCIVCKYNDRNRTSTSPDEVSYYAREKGNDKTRSPHTGILFSEASPETKVPDSFIKANKSIELSKPHTQSMICLQHNEILVMYSEKTKQFLCAQCFYLKQKNSGSVLPIRNAIELISAQNRVNRQQSRLCLSQVQTAMKVCSHNIRMLQNTESHFREVLHQQFKQLRKQLDRRQREIQNNIQQLLDQRLNEFNRILKDLEYLKSSIKEYREYNKENQNVNTMIYVFEAYKMIKNTIKNLDMKYHQYTNIEMDVVKLDKQIFISALDDMFKIKHQLPIKSIIQSTESIARQKVHRLSRSIYEQQRSKHQKNNSTELVRQSQSKLRKKKVISPSRQRRQQTSLCNNQLSQVESNLYQRLIHEKFNKIK